MYSTIGRLPVIVDPSHATGRHNMIEPLSKASIIIGAHGLMIEVHYQPELALCDGPQSLRPESFEKMMQSIRQLSTIEGHDIKQLKQTKS